MGPDFVRPQAQAPDDWTSWRSARPELLAPVGNSAALPADWWRLFNDPVLDLLQSRALAGSPDIETAALHIAQARLQRGNTAAQGLPELNASGQIIRQRQSEYGAGTRLFDAVAGGSGGANRDALAKLLGEPFTQYQGGFDASWEIDLWGKIRRSIETADADIDEKTALLDQARLTLAGDIARSYFDLRATQNGIALTRQDIALLGEQTELAAARARGGIISYFDFSKQRSELEALEAQLPQLLAQEAAQVNQIALLIGTKPGDLQDILTPASDPGKPALPDLALGLPSEIALRRPDIRAAEARLHAATAKIGVARADLYPSIRLGGGFSLESYKSENLFDWASRTWSVGPTVDLPLFDGNRRKRVVKLRELEQKEAAVSYQKTVLQAWREIDDALNSYTAEQERNRKLAARAASTKEIFDLASARFKGGTLTYLDVIDAERSCVQASRALAESNQRIGSSFAAINKAIGLH